MRNGIILPFCVTSLWTGIASALSVPFRRDAPSTSIVSFDLFDFGTVSVDGGDWNAIRYITTIYVDDQPYQVQLDTGSSDLWIDTTNVTFSSSVSNTSVPFSVPYADGTVAQGPILVGEVSLGNFTVKHQIFGSAPGSNATDGLTGGILGLASPVVSQIKSGLKNTSNNDNVLLDNIFSKYPNEPNFISFHLTRSEVGITEGGTFTIDEVPLEFTDISTQTTLDVATPELWAITQGGVNINGETITMPSDVNIDYAFIDTGSALIDAPSIYVEAIYRSVAGASRDAGTGMYEIPCNTKLNVSLIFGGTEYYLNPLDTFFFHLDDNLDVVCLGSIFSSGSKDILQWIVGDTFLRNVYTKFNYGNSSSAGNTGPSVQFLSTTDREIAWDQFDVLNNRRWGQYKDRAAGLKANATSNASSGITSTRSASSTTTGDSLLTAAGTTSSAGNTPTSIVSLISSTAVPVSHMIPSGTAESVAITTLSITRTAESVTNSASLSEAKDIADGAINISGNLADTSNSTVDLSGLQRNFYIMMVLIGGAIVLLLVVCVLLLRRPKGVAYMPLSDPRRMIPSRVNYAYQTPHEDN